MYSLLGKEIHFALQNRRHKKQEKCILKRVRAKHHRDGTLFDYYWFLVLITLLGPGFAEQVLLRGGQRSEQIALRLKLSVLD